MDETKLGVFLCDCKGALDPKVDFASLMNFLGQLSDVAVVSRGTELCLPAAQKLVSSQAKAAGAHRIVVAACSPDVCEGKILQGFAAAGFDPSLVTVANLKERCFGEEATRKAQVEIMRAISKARLLIPVPPVEKPVPPRVLVVGGGTCGLEAALEAARLGLEVVLVEKERELGGSLNKLVSLYPLAVSPAAYLAAKKEALFNSKVRVLSGTEVESLEGQVGDFKVKLKGENSETLTVGAVILALGGAYQFLPLGNLALSPPDIISASQLEALLAQEEGEAPKIITFLLDVCTENSRFSTWYALRSALLAQKKWGSEIYICARSLKVDAPGLEELYREVRESGVVFFKFDEIPTVSYEAGKVKVRLKDALLEQEVEIPCDLAVLEERLLPAPGTKELAEAFYVHLGKEGFLQEENVHLYPVNSNRKGIFLAGGCRGETDLYQALREARDAAGASFALLSKGKLSGEERVTVDGEKCTLCLTCIRTCPHHAIDIDPLVRVAKVNPFACEACGICAAECPAKAIQLQGFTDAQLLAALEVGGE